LIVANVRSIIEKEMVKTMTNCGLVREEINNEDIKIMMKDVCHSIIIKPITNKVELKQT
jgi:hypothetical protein